MGREGTLRERNRQNAYAEIGDTAMRLFMKQGFEQTTIEQIAAAVGISTRTFFRYFATKEDIVVGDLMALGEVVQAALRARPVEEGPWEAMTAALAALTDAPHKPRRALETALLTTANPALRARHLEKHLRWQELLVPEIERRMGVEPGPVPDPRAHAIVGACLACLDTAMEIWAKRDGEGTLEEIYLEALTAIRT
ncbi:TetR family transcriptional regulator [Nocardia sp. NPDC050710]|uniref:TetR family transcriptional regulator n=1 Tax=Nocardia sp. NPDC050710 TaxID=3157220 RepID=UPI00340ABA65